MLTPVALAYRIHIEEDALLTALGDPYRSYAEHPQATHPRHLVTAPAPALPATSHAQRSGTPPRPSFATPAGVAICLLIFLAAQSTYVVDPRLAPDLGHVPGMTAAGEASRIVPRRWTRIYHRVAPRRGARCRADRRNHRIP